MNVRQRHGRLGEQLAADLMKAQGIQIVTTNWRYKRAEIDIIGLDGEVLVFVEVKMRSSTDFGRPAEMVGRQKRRKIIDAAMAYMRQHRYDWEIRFDVVAILPGSDGNPVIQWFKDAFFPGLDYTG